MRIPVSHGTRYAVGLDLPFFLSQSAVASWAREHGFTSISVRDRGASLAYDPRRAARYSDTWDTVVEATYGGTASSIEAPGTPAWMVVLSAPASVEKKKRAAKRRPPSKRPRKA